MFYYCITKWTKNVTDSGRDEYTHRLPKLRETLKRELGEVPTLYDFRLLDGDGLVYAYGKATSCDDEGAFIPLDDYTDDYGCVEIQYKEDGVYKTL